MHYNLIEGLPQVDSGLVGLLIFAVGAITGYATLRAKVAQIERDQERLEKDHTKRIEEHEKKISDLDNKVMDKLSKIETIVANIQGQLTANK